VIIVYGILGFSGYVIDSAIVSIPILLSFAIAMAYNIHIFAYFRRRMLIHGQRKTAIVEAVKEIGWPVLFSALTTMAALFTFFVVPVKPLQFVGIATSSCVLLTFLIVILLMPSMLSFGKDRKPHPIVQEKGGNWLDLQFEKLGGVAMSWAKFTIIFSILITVFVIIGLFKVEPAFDIEKTIGRKVPYAKNVLEISETELGSLYSYDLMIEFPEPGSAKQPENLQKLEELSVFVTNFKLTKRTTSILDIIKDLNQTLNENDPAYYRIPDDEAQIAQLLLLYENAGGTESEYWIDYDYRRLRLMVELGFYNSVEAERELKVLQQQASIIFPTAKVTAVGSLPQFTTMMQYVVMGQLKSFLMSLGIIAILLMLAFRSIRVGLIGMIPNIAPALAVGGVMGWFGIPLDMMTATVMPMILGLAVDDTIHFFNHTNLEFNRTGNYRQSILRSFKTVGVALLLSTVVLVANFSIYATSSSKAYFNMGLMSVVGMTAALLADLFITPILVKWFNVYGKEATIN